MDIDYGEFQQISRFCTQGNHHILKMGIVLSENHPVLSDSKALKELREKSKATKIDISTDKACFNICGSLDQISKCVKLMAVRVINAETRYQQSLLKKQGLSDGEEAAEGGDAN